MKIPFALLFLMVCGCCALAQNMPLSDIELAEKIALYGKVNNRQSMFLHTDKTVYTNNETLWFSGYLLNTDAPGKLHTVLTANLVSQTNRHIEITEKFYMQDGLCFGSIVLPDSIPEGEYILQAYTNMRDQNGIPTTVFTQPVTIKSIRPAGTDNKPQLPDPLNKKAVGIKLDRPDAPPTHQTVKFYPEGGYLSYGLKSRVGFEITNTGGQPAADRAVILQNGRPLDTVSISPYHMGSFSFVPLRNQKYTLQLLGTNQKSAGANSLILADLYPIPDATETGVVLSVGKAVADDTLRMEIYSDHLAAVKVLIHNYQDTYAAVELSLRPGQNKLAVALPSLLRGIHTISVLDSLGRPVAERLFFAHYHSAGRSTVQTDKQTYRKREAVKLKLMLSDETGKPVSGIVSVACVQENRIQHSKFQDIQDYYYLRQYLSDLPADAAGKAIDDAGYIENMLLIRGWRRYRWQEMITLKSNDTLTHYSIFKNSGRVKYGGKTLKKPVEISLMNGKEIAVIQTDNSGRFFIADSLLSSRYKEQVLLSVNKNNKTGYTIDFPGDDPFTARPLISLADISQPLPVRGQTDEIKLNPLEAVMTLREVKIKAVKNDIMFGTKAFGSNECGDYVDGYGYLNYVGSKNSRMNRPPVKGVRYIDGKKYIRADGSVAEYNPITGQTEGGEFTVAFIVYEGCTTEQDPLVTRTSGIYMAKEFYPLTAEQLESSAAQYLSTLYWMPGLIPDKNGTLECTFPAGDIRGDFRIIVQGVSDHGVISAASKITVN